MVKSEFKRYPNTNEIPTRTAFLTSESYRIENAAVKRARSSIHFDPKYTDTNEAEVDGRSCTHLDHMLRVTESTLSVRIRFIRVHVVFGGREKGKEMWIRC